MKGKVQNVVLLHGFAESPEKVWFPWLHRNLEELGMKVWAPVFPDSLRPTQAKWMPVVKKRAKEWDGSTIIVGHSIGGVVGLRALERHCPRKVRAVITVGSPYTSTVKIKELVDFFAAEVDWAELRKKASEFVTIQAKNDPLVPYDHAVRYKESLRSRLVLSSAGSHFIGKKAEPVLKEIKRLAR